MSKTYKRAALDALRGNWKTAVVTGFVASLIGGTLVTTSTSFDFKYEDFYTPAELDAFFATSIGQTVNMVLLVLSVIALVSALVSLIFGGAASMGYASYNLNLLDGKTAVFHDLFSHMNRKWKGFCMIFFTGLYIFLWGLLFVIPGIVKSFAYAMTPYILAENPEMSANDAIAESQFIMTGHKWDLFCLHLSFIGWYALVMFPALALVLYALFTHAALDKLLLAFFLSMPLCAGNLFLRPYIEAANAAFYRSLAPKKEEPAEEWYQPA